MTYINRGPLKGDKSYLVVKGGRVYTGDTFDASDSDVEALRRDFNIESVDGQDNVEDNQQVSFVEEEDYENFYETEEDAFDSASDKSTSIFKGVK